MAKTDIIDFWLWPLEAAKTAMAVGDTMRDAGTVVGARAPLLRQAMADPLRADVVELSRMVSEKYDAFGQVGRVLASGQGAVQRAMRAQARDIGRAATGKAFGPADWWRMAERNLALWSTLAALPAATLRPISARAAGNARRLKKRSAR